MDASFDPYYKWLGIPPEDQPADYYRLLGLRVYEHDADVIENAADQRMLLLRSRQTGPHVDLCQQLLNEVVAARNTLLDRIQRETYNDSLRGRSVEQRISPPPELSTWADRAELNSVPLPESKPLASSIFAFSSQPREATPVESAEAPQANHRPPVPPPIDLPVAPLANAGDEPSSQQSGAAHSPAERIKIEEKDLPPPSAAAEESVETVDAVVVEEEQPLVDEWRVQTPDGNYYGPVSKAELDAWVAKGRIGPDFHILQVGVDDLREAVALYPQLQPPVTLVQPSTFHCERCGSGALPLVRRRVSTLGWVVFVLLLVCFPLNVLGLLITEEYRVCRRCGIRVG